ncbi:hypothetical protein [Rossellomorea sp. NS-SX7]|uniref:hypothetical protein n=1 Tax=Rossellomorea sp. NS-SX7 TaxID=3463856 RepID=UPI004059DC11
MDKETIMEWHRMAGLPWIGILIGFLSEIGLFYYHVVSLIAFFLTGICLDVILKHHSDIIGKYERFFIVSIFLIFPVFTERILVIIGWYTIPYLLFFIGWMLLAAYFNKPSKWIRVFTLILLFLSFSHNAFLFFYGLVLIYILYRKFPGNLSEIILLPVKYVDFILLPIAAFALQRKFQPYGLYEGYNDLTISRLINGISASFKAVKYSFYDVIGMSFNNVVVVVAALCTSVLIFYIIRRKNIGGMIKSNGYKKDIYLLLFGLLALYMAVYPYSAVGKLAEHTGWHGRWQLLVPLGAAFTIYYSMKLLFGFFRINKQHLVLVHTILIVLFVSLNLSFYIEYYRDYFKQQGFIHSIQETDIVAQHSTFIIKDNTLSLNAKQRSYNFYEYNYLMEKAMGVPSRLNLIFGKNQEVGDLLKYSKYKNYHFNKYEPSEPEVLIEVNQGDHNLEGDFAVLQLLFNQYFNQSLYDSRIKEVINIQYSYINNE